MFKGKLTKSVKPISRDILHNKWALYGILAVALINLLSAVVNGDYLFATYFILIAFIISFFNKNLVVILTLAVAIANILKLTYLGKRMEGMETKDEKKDSENKNGEKKDSKEAKSKGDNEEPDTDIADANPTAEAENAEYDQVYDKAKELLATQEKIVDGFERIEPYMNRAETLITEIDQTAKKLQGMQSGK